MSIRNISNYYYPVRSDSGNVILSEEKRHWGTAVVLFSTQAKLREFMLPYTEPYRIQQIIPHGGIAFATEVAARGWRLVIDPHMNPEGNQEWDEVEEPVGMAALHRHLG